MSLLVLILVCVVCVASYYVVFQGKRTASGEKYPAELLGAQCVMNESMISMASPAKLSGRIDQLYKQSKSSQHYIVDTKNRASGRAFPSDRAQLSVYRTILRSKGYDVSEYGFVRFPDAQGHGRYKKVRLYPDSKVFGLYDRYVNLKSGASKSVCSCGKH